MTKRHSVGLWLAAVACLETTGCSINPRFVSGMVGKTYTVSDPIIESWSQDGRRLYVLYQTDVYRYDASPIVKVEYDLFSSKRPLYQKYLLDVVDLSTQEVECHDVPYDIVSPDTRLHTHFNPGANEKMVTIVSPDGKRILYFVRYVTSNNGFLGVRDFATGMTWNRGKVGEAVAVVAAAWSPDSNQIIYQTDDGIFLDSADGSTASESPKRISADAPEARWLQQVVPLPTLELLSDAPDEFRAVIKDATGHVIRQLDLERWKLPSGHFDSAYRVGSSPGPNHQTEWNELKRSIPCIQVLYVETPLGRHRETRKKLWGNCLVDGSGRYLLERTDSDSAYFIMDMETGRNTLIERQICR